MLSILQHARHDPTSTDGNAWRFERYWQKCLDTWATRLDYIIRLEASDQVLHQRIIDRGTHHVAARFSRSQITGFFAMTREARTRIIAGLRERPDGPILVRLRTDQLTLQQSVEQILAHLDEAVV
jgi:hypothetical protein